MTELRVGANGVNQGRKQILLTSLCEILSDFPVELLALVVSFDLDWRIVILSQESSWIYDPIQLYVYDEIKHSLVQNPISLSSEDFNQPGKDAFCCNKKDIFISVAKTNHDKTENSYSNQTTLVFLSEANDHHTLTNWYAPNDLDWSMRHLDWSMRRDGPRVPHLHVFDQSRLIPLPPILGHKHSNWTLAVNVSINNIFGHLVLLDTDAGTILHSSLMASDHSTYSVFMFWSKTPVISLILANTGWKMPIVKVTIQNDGTFACSPLQIPIPKNNDYRLAKLDDYLMVSHSPATMRLYKLSQPDNEASVVHDVTVTILRDSVNPTLLLTKVTLNSTINLVGQLSVVCRFQEKPVDIHSLRSDQRDQLDELDVPPCGHGIHLCFLSINLVELPEKGTYASPHKYGCRLWKLQNISPTNQPPVSIPIPFRDIIRSGPPAHKADLLISNY